MKNSVFLFIGALCLIIASCSKDPGFIPGPDLRPAFNKSGFPHITNIVVPPSGGDDTETLTDAIANAKPGTTIRLLAGEYHVGLMEIYNFNGKLIGAGRDKTIITLLTPIPILSQIEKNQTPGWWRMIGGDFVISDMTFRTPDGILTDDYDPVFFGRDLYSIFMLNDYNDFYYFPEEPGQSARFERLNIYGGTNPDMSEDVAWVTDHNTWLGIWIGIDYWWPADGLVYPLTAGDYNITNCSFNHFINAAEGFSLGEKAKMKVSACNIDNTDVGMYFTANYNSNIIITGNLFTNSITCDMIIEDIDYGFLPFTPVSMLSKCKYTIMNNTFTASNPITSIIFWDTWAVMSPQERLPMQLLVRSNMFNLIDGSTGILAMNSQHALFSNNKFRGSCTTGIMVDGFLTDRLGMVTLDPELAYAKNCQLVLNSFSGVESDEADIILGARTKNCTVVGSASDVIIDNGIRNKVAGLKPVSKKFSLKSSVNNDMKMWHGRERY